MSSKTMPIPGPKPAAAEGLAPRKASVSVSKPAAPSESLQSPAPPEPERFNSTSGFGGGRGIPAGAPTNELSFGPFRLLPAQFLLLEGDKPVPLGSRALHMLMILLERPGELVTRQELMARVWPNLFVVPHNLNVHISALRRALRDGWNGNRFIVNIPGRGYCFVAPTR